MGHLTHAPSPATPLTHNHGGGDLSWMTLTAAPRPFITHRTHTQPMAIGVEPAAGFVALVLIAILTSSIRPKGRLRRALAAASDKRDTATEAHAAIPDIRDTIEEIDEQTDRIYEKVESIEQKTDRNRYLILEFHGDEEVSVPVDDLADEEEHFYRGGRSSK